MDMNSYIPSYIFLKSSNTSCSNYQAKLFCPTGSIHDPKSQLRKPESKKIIDKVHKHAFGHESLPLTFKYYYNARTCGMPKLKNASIGLFLHVMIELKHMNPKKTPKHHSFPTTDRSIRLCAYTFCISAIFAFVA